MNYLRMFVDICSAGLDMTAIYIFCSAVGGKRIASNKVTAFLYGLFFILSSLVVLLLNSPFMLLGTMTVLCIAVMFMYRCSFFTKLFAGIIVTILAVLSEIITGTLLAVISTKSVEELNTNIAFYIRGVLISKSMLLIFVKTIQYKKLPSSLKSSKSLMLPMLALPASTIFIIYIMASYAYSTANIKFAALVAVASIMLIVANILVFYLFEKQLRQDEETQKNTLMQQQLQYQTQYFKEMAEKYKLSNKTVHDTKNQLFAVSIAIENNDMEKAKNKINELCNNVSGGANIIRTGNDALDALLNTKYNDFKEQNIQFEQDIVINLKNQIDDIDLCIIIGNALDNAIEACSKIDNNDLKVITLRMAQVHDHLAIEMTNPTSASIRKAGGKLITSKKEKELHGFGMQSMEEIVNKYNGNLSYSQDGNSFILKIYVENAAQIVENFA